MNYGIHDYQINTKLLDTLNCPECGLPLRRIALMDPFLYGLMCNAKHRYFVPLKVSSIMESKECHLINTPEGHDIFDLIRNWLTVIEYRSKLNEQLAVILRRIYEIHKDKVTILGQPLPYQYCPFCSVPLEQFQQVDIWVQGLRCPAGHEFLVRSGMDFSIGNTNVRLQQEMRDENLSSLVNAWLTDSEQLKSQLNEQIRKILECYKMGRFT